MFVALMGLESAPYQESLYTVNRGGEHFVVPDPAPSDRTDRHVDLALFKTKPEVGCGGLNMATSANFPIESSLHWVQFSCQVANSRSLLSRSLGVISEAT